MHTPNTEQERKDILFKYKQLLRSCRHRLYRGDKKQIRLAFEMALEGHKDMRRKTGEPYIFHPLDVALIVSNEIGLLPVGMENGAEACGPNRSAKGSSPDLIGGVPGGPRITKSGGPAPSPPHFKPAGMG